MSTSLYLRPDLDQGASSREGFSLHGMLRPAEVEKAYSGNLTLFGYHGSVRVEQISGDTLPVGHTISVDGNKVVIEWPAYAEQSAAIRNAGFDSLLDGWDHGAGWIASSDHITPPFCAAYSETNGTSVLSSKSRYPIVPGVEINASCRVEQGASAAGNAGAGVALEFRDEAGEVLQRSSGEMIMSGSNGEVKTSSLRVTAPDLPGLATVNIACIAVRKKENLDVWVDDFKWDLQTPAVGVKDESFYTITLKATDSAGRTAFWTGKVSVLEPVFLLDYRKGSYNAGFLRIKLANIMSPDPDRDYVPVSDPLDPGGAGYGWWIGKLMPCNGLLFAFYNGSSSRSVLVSNDIGLTWVAAHGPATFTLYMPVTFDGVYYYSGQMRSPDGLNWELLPSFPSDITFTVGNSQTIVIARHSERVLIALSNVGTKGRAVSYDHGETWQPAHLFPSTHYSVNWTDDGDWMWYTFNSTSLRRTQNFGETSTGFPDHNDSSYDSYYNDDVLVLKTYGNKVIFLRDRETMEWVRIGPITPSKIPTDPYTGSNVDNTIAIGNGKASGVIIIGDNPVEVYNASIMRYWVSKDRGNTFTKVEFSNPQKRGLTSLQWSDLDLV